MLNKNNFKKIDYRKLNEGILEKIYISSLHLLEPLTDVETYKIIVKEALGLVNAEFGSIFLDQEGVIKRVYSSTPIMYKIAVRKNGYTYKSFSQRKIYVLNSNKLQKIHPEVLKLGIQSTIFIPLTYFNHSIGVLSLDSLEKEFFTKEQLHVLQLFGSMATLAIIKTQSYMKEKEAVSVRDLFISMAAHELRTPLTTINGYAQLLQKKIVSDLLPYKKWINQMVQEGIRLSQLINELLEVSKIRSGKFQYVWKECHMRDIIERAISIFKITHENNKIYFTNYVSYKKDLLIGDTDKLLQMLINLLNNAAKFSSEEKPINLVLDVDESMLKVTVKDQGKGISKKDLPFIFDDFYKGNEGKIEGMGLGLFLSKNIITQHHGKIIIKSKEQIGTTIAIYIPIIKN